MNKARLTQRDVARQAGVSQAVVSYVLNGTNVSAVSDETRKRVLEAIDELGYVPHGVARGMRTGRSMLIGSVIPDITNPFYPAFQRGVQDVAEVAGFSLVTFNSDGRRDREQSSIRATLQCGVDGLIVSLFQTSSEELALVRAQNIPLVVYGALMDQPLQLPYDLLDIDVSLATHQVLTYLYGKGHRSIGLIDGPEDRSRKRPRVRAYKEALSEHCLPFDKHLIVYTEFSEVGGYEAMSRLLERSSQPTSVIAANDVIAMGVLSKVNEVGLSVPDDIAIVGYDDIPAARLLSPSLTTVALHPERIGARAVEMLLDRINGTVTGEGRCEFLPHTLVIRASA